MIMGTNNRQGMLLNIVVGIIGAFLGGLLIAPMLGTGTINQGDFSVSSLLVSLVGAVVLLASSGCSAVDGTRSIGTSQLLEIVLEIARRRSKRSTAVAIRRAWLPRFRQLSVIAIGD